MAQILPPGIIPPQLGDLDALEYLCLQSNRLEGSYLFSALVSTMSETTISNTAAVYLACRVCRIAIGNARTFKSNPYLLNPTVTDITQK